MRLPQALGRARVLRNWLLLSILLPLIENLPQVPEEQLHLL
jgi:hypothetical protein